MHDLPVMDVLQGKTALGENVKNLRFRNALPTSGLDHSCKVSTISVAHYNAKLVLFGFVYFPEFNYIWMVHYFKDFGLFQSLTSFSFTELTDIDLLDNSQWAIWATFD